MGGVHYYHLKNFLFIVMGFLNYKFEFFEGYSFSLWQVWLFTELFTVFINFVQRTFGKQAVEE